MLSRRAVRSHCNDISTISKARQVLFRRSIHQISANGVQRRINTPRFPEGSKPYVPHYNTTFFPRLIPSTTSSLIQKVPSTQRHKSTINHNNMASQFSKATVREGDKQNYPKTGDTVVMEYTGNLTPLHVLYLLLTYSRLAIR